MAAGRTPTNPNATTFTILDGRVIDLPEFLPSLFRAEEAIELWAVENQPERYARDCPLGIAGQDVITGLGCAELIAEFADIGQCAVVVGKVVFGHGCKLFTLKDMIASVMLAPASNITKSGTSPMRA